MPLVRINQIRRARTKSRVHPRGDERWTNVFDRGDTDIASRHRVLPIRRPCNYTKQGFFLVGQIDFRPVGYRYRFSFSSRIQPSTGNFVRPLIRRNLAPYHRRGACRACFNGRKYTRPRRDDGGRHACDAHDSRWPREELSCDNIVVTRAIIARCRLVIVPRVPSRPIFCPAFFRFFPFFFFFCESKRESIFAGKTRARYSDCERFNFITIAR